MDVASVTSDEGRDPKRKRSRSIGGEDQLKKRLWLLFRTVLDYQVGSEIGSKFLRILPSTTEYQFVNSFFDKLVSLLSG